MAGIVPSYIPDASLQVDGLREQKFFPEAVRDNEISNSRTVELMANRPFRIAFNLKNVAANVTTVTSLVFKGKPYGNDQVLETELAATIDNDLTDAANGNYVIYVKENKIPASWATDFVPTPDGAIAVWMEIGDGSETIQIFDRINVYDEVFDGQGQTPIAGTKSLLLTGGTMSGTINMNENPINNTLDPVDANGVGDRGFNDTRYLAQFDDFFVPAKDMFTRTDNGAAAGSVELAGQKIMVESFDFAQGVSQFIQFYRRMPDNWDRGEVKAKFLWTSTIAGPLAVVFTLRARAFSSDDALDQALGGDQSVTDTITAADTLLSSPATAALTIDGSPALDDMIIWEIQRDGGNVADTLTADAKLLGIAIQYKKLATLAAEW